MYIHLYCEKHVKNKYAIFDFYKKEDLNIFLTLFSDDVSEIDERSLIYIEGFKTLSYEGPREGMWYRFPIDFFGNNFILRDSIIEESAIFRLFLSYSGEELELNKYKTIIPSLNFTNEVKVVSKPDPNFELKPKENEEIKLEVFGVGHGNWNAIKSDSFNLFYDTGADMTWGINQLTSLARRLSISQLNNLHIILSHWDVDHYHGILGMSSSDLNAIQSFIAPSQVPNNLTAQRVLNKIRSVIRPILIKPTPKTSREIMLSSVYNNEFLEIFRASTGSYRNQTGIVVLVNGPDHTALLTGDHHYKKLEKYVLRTYSHNSYIMVIPHHGGYAGKWNSSLFTAYSIEGTMSCFDSNNRFNHPTTYNVNNLNHASIPWKSTKGLTDLPYIL
ncbi:hypothetical protein KHA94_24245 [Bacillus sp. FJAT-49705]|uniref:Uncharacterized protein n=1 Tax=Cytobacillus citreus TaxID=2833586 RepID=A0ABS5NZD8_9BACI|nr:hypothetical protein [Cytobacillus citreus]MBS4193207.1 hypothetical protein [Cytobacillus citreus]